MTKIRSLYNADRETHRKPIRFHKPSMVSQEFKQDTDVKTILRRYQAAQISPYSTEEQNVYNTFDKDQDYHYWQNQILKVKKDFEKLSSENRAHFGNDPGKFYMYMQDPDNYQDGVDRGIFKKIGPPEPQNEPLPPLDEV